MFGAKKRLSVSRNYLLQNAGPQGEMPAPAVQSDLRPLPTGHMLPPLQPLQPVGASAAQLHASEARMKQMEDKIDLVLDAGAIRATDYLRKVRACDEMWNADPVEQACHQRGGRAQDV